MKYTVSASEYKDLSDDLQKLYGSETDGNHTIKISGMPDYAAQEKRITDMDAKVAELLTETKAAKKAKKDAETAATQAAHNQAQKDGDVDALTKSWEKKYSDLESGLTLERDEALSLLGREKVHSKAVELATTLAVQGSADVLLPHIETRLSMEIKDGRAVTVVKDTAGQPSALTVDELGKEIAANAAFAPLIVASNAAGGGANGRNNGGAVKSKTATNAQFMDMNPSERMQFAKDGGQILEP